MHAMLKTAVLSVALGLASIAIAQSTPDTTATLSTQPTTEPSAETTALVEQLHSDEATKREAARQSLLDLGEDAIPALQLARKATHDPDLQVRIDTLLVQVRDHVDMGATKITLQFNEAPLDVIVASLAKQSHGIFAIGEMVAQFGGQNQLPKMTLDLQNVSFWTAINTIQDNGNILFFPQPDGWHANRAGGQTGSSHGSEAGAFYIQPMMASYSRTIAYARNFGGGEQFTLQFQALCEPKVKLASGAGFVQFDRVVDSNGNDLIAGQRSQQFGTGPGQNPIGFGMQLKYPKNAGATIAEVRGTMKFTMARRIETVHSDDIATDHRIEGTIEGVKIVVEALPVDPNAQGVVSLGLTLEAAGDLGSLQRLQQSFQTSVHVTDAQDAPLTLVNSTQPRSDGHGAEYRLAYSPAQPQGSTGPYKVRVDVPSGFRAIEVPFVIRDLKMP